MPEQSDSADPDGAATRGTEPEDSPRPDGDDHDRAPTERDDTPPPEVVDAAERLTHRARETPSDEEAAAYRADRDKRLAEHGYTARVRSDERRDVLVVHPAAWLEDGRVQMERVEHLERGIEVPLSGPGDADDWAAVDAHNREVVAAVREAHGEVHGDNAAAFADFMGNHYAKPVESARRAELDEFLTEYYPRNAWPSDEQRDVIEESVRLVFDAADARCPLTERPR